ncbi:MAG: LamG-like jellyroll fold domain-containing protein, partial [Planctomycetaceae bacterium]
MAQHRGRLFCGTLPSGKVWSFSSGTVVTDDRQLKPGWHHLAAIRQAGRISLFVDGQLAASATPGATVDNLQNAAIPLELGRGAGDTFYG